MRKLIFLPYFLLMAALLPVLPAWSQDYKLASDSSGMPSFLPPEAGIRGGLAPVTDRDIFNPHLFYSQSKQLGKGFNSIRARRKVYKQLNDSLHTVSHWFEAARIVTKRNSVGAAERFNFWLLNKKACHFMRQGSAFLFVFNKNIAEQLRDSGKVNRIFVTAYFADSSRREVHIYEKDHKELDEALILFEQTLVQDYIDIYRQQYPTVKMDKVFRCLNKAMRFPFAPRQIRKVIKKNFSRKKRFHFQSFDDRVTLGLGLIDLLYKEAK